MMFRPIVDATRVLWRTAAEPAGSQQLTAAQVFRQRVNVLRFGADPTGGEDSWPAFQAALASLDGQDGEVFAPDGVYRLSNGITVPAGSSLRGQSMMPCDGTGVPHGTVLKFDNGVMTCVSLGDGNNTMGALSNLSVWRTGAPPAGSVGILSSQVYAIQMENVNSANHAVLYSFFESGAAGINANLINCYGSDCSQYYFLVDTWPELRITGGRFGRNGVGELQGSAYFCVQQTGVVNPASGPNGIFVTNTQFNQGGVAGPANLLVMQNMAGGGDVGEFAFVNCHVEHITGAYFDTLDATATLLSNVSVDTCVFNTGVPLFNLNPATQLNECRFTNSKLAGSVSLNTNALINRVGFSNCEISGAATFNGAPGIQNNMFIDGCFFNNGLTLEGTWVNLNVQAVVGGGFANNPVQFSAGASFFIDVQGSTTRTGCGFVERKVSYSATTGTTMDYWTARGSSGAPAVSQQGDIAVREQAWAYDGANFGMMGLWRIQSSGAAPSAGSTPGSIIFSTTAPGANSPVDRVTLQSSGYLVPATDNAYQLGSSTARYSTVWSATAAIQTSDQRTKTNIQSLSPVQCLAFINAHRPVSYLNVSGGKVAVRQVYRNDAGDECAPDAEGAKAAEIITQDVAGKRTHYGLIAQEAKAVCERLGIDFGGWVLSDVSDPNSLQALRYDEYIAPLMGAVMALSARLAALEAAK
jgi:hypothetical protein